MFSIFAVEIQTNWSKSDVLLLRNTHFVWANVLSNKRCTQKNVNYAFNSNWRSESEAQAPQRIDNSSVKSSLWNNVTARVERQLRSTFDYVASACSQLRTTPDFVFSSEKIDEWCDSAMNQTLAQSKANAVNPYVWNTFAWTCKMGGSAQHKNMRH